MDDLFGNAAVQPIGRMIARCTAFAAGSGPAPDVRSLIASVAAAKRADDGARLAGVALCAAAVTEAAHVVALVGAVGNDYARCQLFEDAIKLQLLRVEHAAAACAVMEPGGS
jgi:hypothetical protein